MWFWVTSDDSVEAWEVELDAPLRRYEALERDDCLYDRCFATQREALDFLRLRQCQRIRHSEVKAQEARDELAAVESALAALAAEPRE